MATATATATHHGPTRASPWLISGRADPLLVANLAWPIVAALGAVAVTSPSLTFVQLYFISAAHRFITLPLVFLDSKWFPAQAGRFGRAGALCTLLALGGVLFAQAFPHPTDPANTLLYLMQIDFVWNAWHFASQHAGIFRIYGRRAGLSTTEPEAEREKALIRAMALWVILRTGLVVGLGRGSIPAEVVAVAGWLDPLMFVGPLLLLARELRAWSPERSPRALYLGSVVTLYAAIAASLHGTSASVRSGILLAHALFHAIEYITICGWVMGTKKGGAWTWIAPRLRSVVLAFLLVVGALNWGVMNLGSEWAWVFMTLWVGFLHYTYDGMIWKTPKPALARI